MTKIEQVARAIYARNPEIDRSKPIVFSWEAVGKPDPRIIPWEKAPQECRDLVLKAARDAVEALHEPPPHIVQAGCNVSTEISAGQVFHAWQAMVEAILAEHPTEVETFVGGVRVDPPKRKRKRADDDIPF